MHCLDGLNMIMSTESNQELSIELNGSVLDIAIHQVHFTEAFDIHLFGACRAAGVTAVLEDY